MNQQLSEAIAAASGGNSVVTLLFWAIVAFVAYLVYTGKWKLIFAAVNPAGAAVELGKDALSDLVDVIQGRLSGNVDQKTAVPAKPVGVAEYLAKADAILQGVPAEKRWEIASQGPDEIGLYKAANAYLLRQEVANAGK